MLLSPSAIYPGAATLASTPSVDMLATTAVLSTDPTYTVHDAAGIYWAAGATPTFRQAALTTAGAGNSVTWTAQSAYATDSTSYNGGGFTFTTGAPTGSGFPGFIRANFPSSTGVNHYLSLNSDLRDQTNADCLLWAGIAPGSETASNWIAHIGPHIFEINGAQIYSIYLSAYGGNTTLALGQISSVDGAAYITTSGKVTAPGGIYADRPSATASATGTALTLSGQVCTGTASTGGDAILTGGTGTTKAGAAVLSGHQIVGLCDGYDTILRGVKTGTTTSTSAYTNAFTFTIPAGVPVIVDMQIVGSLSSSVFFRERAIYSALWDGSNMLVNLDGSYAALKSALSTGTWTHSLIPSTTALYSALTYSTSSNVLQINNGYYSVSGTTTWTYRIWVYTLSTATGRVTGILS